MVSALATGNAIALAVMAAIFIAFALVSAFLIPRRSPNFPGRRLGWYVLATFVLFVAMMSTVLIFGKEEETAERANGESPAAQSTNASTETGSSAEPPAPTQTETGGESSGDATAGKQVFAKAGCGGCHTLDAAGASGTVGPNLDEAKPD